jgi:hypothetical protein
MSRGPRSRASSLQIPPRRGGSTRAGSCHLLAVGALPAGRGAVPAAWVGVGEGLVAFLAEVARKLRPAFALEGAERLVNSASGCLGGWPSGEQVAEGARGDADPLVQGGTSDLVGEYPKGAEQGESGRGSRQPGSREGRKHPASRMHRVWAPSRRTTPSLPVLRPSLQGASPPAEAPPQAAGRRPLLDYSLGVTMNGGGPQCMKLAG